MQRKFLIILLITSSLYSQNKSKVNIFLDENLKLINDKTFYEKRNSFVNYSEKHENDSLIINRILKIIEFGKLDSAENNQIRLLLERDSGQNNFKENLLVLTYRDTLVNYENYSPFKLFAKMPKSHFLSGIRQYDRNQKKCIKRNLKDGIKRLYFYNVNKGYNYIPKNFSWNHSSSILNTVLFKNRSSMLILKPDGEYFYFIEIYEKLPQALLEADSWEPFIEDYELANKNLVKEPFGKLINIELSLKEMSSQPPPQNLTHCYYFGDF